MLKIWASNADLNGVTTIRNALAAAAVAVAVVPAATAHATGDASDTIRSLASEAAQLVAQEQQLVTIVDPRNVDVSPIEQTDANARLETVDARGSEILVQLERLDVDVTEAVRATLDQLPDDGRPENFAFDTPGSAVYSAAIDDLRRLAETPDSAIGTTAGSSSPAIGLVAVAALALLALGVAALGNTLRRRPEHEELAAMAWSDGLTGLANRRRLDRDLAENERLSGTSSVIMVDVDHFKNVNDSFGHERGDEILRQLGTMLAHQVRHDDVVYRYGGEEFCILLPETSIDEAGVVANRIVEAARRIELPDGEHLTVSIGVADSVDGEIASAVQTADRALEDAKGQGRDRAVTTPTGERSLEPA